MTTIVLYGFNDPHSRAVIDELRLQDETLAIYDADWRQNVADSATKRDEVALVWCIGSSLPLPIAIANEIAQRGIPVVAVADISRVDLFDFNSGYIELCFDYPTSAELRARIRTVIARSTIESKPLIIHGDLTIDVNSFAVSLDGRNIELTYKEYELLKLFASNPGRVFRREDILNRIWGDDYFGGTRTVDVHVRRLRSKLDDVSHNVIETMWRVGYRFTAPESRASASNGDARPSVSVT